MIWQSAAAILGYNGQRSADGDAATVRGLPLIKTTDASVVNDNAASLHHRYSCAVGVWVKSGAFFHTTPALPPTVSTKTAARWAACAVCFVVDEQPHLPSSPCLVAKEHGEG